MAGLRKILITLLVLVLILLALVFSLNNQMAVSLNFLLFETQPHGVAVWIIMAFVIGALVGVLVTTMATVRTSVSRLPSHYGRGFRSGPSAVSLYQLL